MPSKACFFLLVACLVPGFSIGQPVHLVPVERPVVETLGRLQARGLLLELNPAALPWDEAEIRAALNGVDRIRLDEVDAALLGIVEGRLSTETPGNGLAVVGIRFLPGVRATNNGRLNPLRYLPDSDDNVFQNAGLEFRFAAGRFASVLALRHDLYYDRDPDGLDTALRWLSRTEDSYLRYESRYVGIELGRFSRHWGLPGGDALFVSANPRSYDQVAFRLGGQRLSVRAMLGELDSITGDGRFTGVAGADSVLSGSERRYLAAHRLDWRPTPNFLLYFLQSTLYSGPNAGPSIRYLNPFHSVIFSLDTVPKNDENNGLVGLGFFWRRGSATISFQGLVDDVDVLNFSEPTSFAVTGSATLAGLTPRMDVTAGGTAVSARAYNTVQAEGKYVYMLRGIATQFSDYAHLFAQADIYIPDLARGLVLGPRLDLLLQGEQDIRGPYPLHDAEVETILTGTVERTIRAALRITYDSAPWFFLRLDVGINSIDSAGHVRGASRTEFVALLELGLRVVYDYAFPLDFPK